MFVFRFPISLSKKNLKSTTQSYSSLGKALSLGLLLLAACLFNSACDEGTTVLQKDLTTSTASEVQPLPEAPSSGTLMEEPAGGGAELAEAGRGHIHTNTEEGTSGHEGSPSPSELLELLR